MALSPAAPWEEGFIVLFLCGGWGRMRAGGRYKLRIHGVGRAGTFTVFPQAVFALCDEEGPHCGSGRVFRLCRRKSARFPQCKADGSDSRQTEGQSDPESDSGSLIAK